MADLLQWKGLLHWSMKYQDKAHATSTQPLTDEDRQYLENVMRDMVMDPINEMKTILRVLNIPEDLSMVKPAELADALRTKEEEEEETKSQTKSQTQTPAEPVSFTATQLQDMHANLLQKKEELLERLEDFVEQMDYANDLHKLGGLAIVLNILRSKHASLRWRAAGVISTVVQNNPVSQKAALDLGALDLLLRNLDLDSIPDDRSDEHKRARKGNSASNSARENDDNQRLTQLKSLLALSSLVRANSVGTKAFLNAGGLPRLVTLFCSEENAAEIRMLRKCINLFKYLWNTLEKIRLSACSKMPQVFPKFATLLLHDDLDLREGALQCLTLLVQDGSSNRDYARLDFLGIRKKLKQRRKQLDLSDEYAAEIELPANKRLSSLLS